MKQNNVKHVSIVSLSWHLR